MLLLAGLVIVATQGQEAAADPDVPARAAPGRVEQRLEPFPAPRSVQQADADGLIRGFNATGAVTSSTADPLRRTLAPLIGLRFTRESFALIEQVANRTLQTVGARSLTATVLGYDAETGTVTLDLKDGAARQPSAVEGQAEPSTGGPGR